MGEIGNTMVLVWRQVQIVSLDTHRPIGKPSRAQIKNMNRARQHCLGLCQYITEQEILLIIELE